MMSLFKRMTILIIAFVMLLGIVLPIELIAAGEERFIVYKYNPNANGFGGTFERYYDYTYDGSSIQMADDGKFVVLNSQGDDATIGMEGSKGMASWHELGYDKDDEVLSYLPTVYDFKAETKAEAPRPSPKISVYKYNSETKKYEPSDDYTYENGTLKVDEDGKYVVLSKSTEDQVEYTNANIRKKGLKGEVSWDELGVDWVDEGFDMPIVYELEAGEDVEVEYGEGEADVIGIEKKSFFQQLEEILSDIVRGSANALIKIINWAVGGKNGVTIDDILFNHYGPTTLAYFSGGSSGDTTGGSTSTDSSSTEGGDGELYTSVTISGNGGYYSFDKPIYIKSDSEEGGFVSASNTDWTNIDTTGIALAKSETDKKGNDVNIYYVEGGTSFYTKVTDYDSMSVTNYGDSDADPDSLDINAGVKIGKQEENEQESLSKVMAETISTWTGVFTQIAIAGYLAVLLYIGIQILFRSTGAKRAEYQRLFVDWVVGIGLLFFFPLVAKYSIEINNALVAQIESAKSANAAAASKIDYSDTSVKSIGANSTAAQRIAFGKSMDASPFSGSDSNYMVQMANKAEKTRRLSYAIVYMIMAWQLLMILITYYRRVFMVGFLLVLFPLVALTYAVDKIKDGKSQAFDRWAKELMINVFLQTFHAIIYVFAINAAFVGGEDGDWILMIMGVSFLFKGEEIIKNLFGQKSDSAPSLASSAMRTAAVFAAVKAGAKKIGDNATHIRKAVNSSRNARMYDMMADNFNILASTGPQFTPNPAALPHAPTGPLDAEATQVGNDIQTVNNMNVATPEALAQAINRLQNYNGRYTNMLQDLNVDITKLHHLQDIKEGAIRQLKAGVDKTRVEQNIRLELETTFGSDQADKMQQVLYHQMTMPLKSNHFQRNKDLFSTAQEVQDARDRRDTLENSFRFSTSPTSLHDRNFTDEVSDLLYDTYGTSAPTKEQIIMGRSITILKNRDSSKYAHGFSRQQQVAAMKYVMEHKDDDPRYKDMIKDLGDNVDEMALTLASKISEDAKTDSSITQKTKDWADSVVNHYMNDENPLNNELDGVSVLTVYREGDTKTNKQIADRITHDRVDEDDREVALLRDFANDRKQDTPAPTPTLNGMTLEDIRAMAENEREMAGKEAIRGVAETMGAAAGIVPGAAAGIAFAETNKGPIAEGLAGAFTGAVVGDQIVAYGLGEYKEREVWMRNPYTGEDEKVVLKVGGALGDHISLNDPLIPENIRGHIDAQFRENAAKKRRVKEAQERARIDRANRNQRLP